ncbi:hypothetical protein [Algoriphagus sp. AK58]|uniref:hypothetical protein n=1 Tax=Algoriphagus sp. AK58 TaxID=1406877 RepID=UPI0021084888|nr:hypothetical protein [Algoriphagus sp. AK58]
MKLLYPILLLLSTFLIAGDQQNEREILEDFNSKKLNHFRYGSTGRKSKFKWKSGVKSKTGNEVLSLKLDPKESVGPGKGPEIISEYFTHFGTYSTRLKVPDPRKTQPNEVL